MARDVVIIKKTNKMSITTRKLSSGDWLINDGEVAWVVSQEDNMSDLKLTEEAIIIFETRSSGFENRKNHYAQIEFDISTGALLPEPNTDDYLHKDLEGNFLTSKLEEIIKYKNIATDNQRVVDNAEIPTLEDHLELVNEVDSLISEPPDDSEGHSINFEPSNQQIPTDGIPLEVIVTYNESDIIVKYVSVTINVNHPSPGTEKLKVMLHSPEGITRQLWYQDFESSNDEQTIETSYFNNENISGEWVLTLIQDVTTDTNVLNSASIMIYY